MIVRGPELALRYPRPEDAEALFALASDPEVTRHFSWGPYTDVSQPLEWIESLEGRRERGEWLEFAIVRADDVPIGVTGLTELSPRDRRAVTGTWLGREHWGTGANDASKALILALAFRRLGLWRVTSLVNPENARSIAALERLGFEREGVLRGWHLHGDARLDCAVLRLTADEFEAGPLAEIELELEGDPPPAFVVA